MFMGSLGALDVNGVSSLSSGVFIRGILSFWVHTTQYEVPDLKGVPICMSILGSGI